MSAYTDADVTFEHVAGIRYRQFGLTSWELGYKGSGHREDVEDGTIFDVSIPRLLWKFFDPHDRRYFKAAALHDELLKRGFDRVTAAGAFNFALKADGVSAGRRFTMTATVAFYKWS